MTKVDFNGGLAAHIYGKLQGQTGDIIKHIL